MVTEYSEKNTERLTQNVVAVFFSADKKKNLEFRVLNVCGDIYYDCEIDYVNGFLNI